MEKGDQRKKSQTFRGAREAILVENAKGGKRKARYQKKERCKEEGGSGGDNQ